MRTRTDDSAPHRAAIRWPALHRGRIAGFLRRQRPAACCAGARVLKSGTGPQARLPCDEAWRDGEVWCAVSCGGRLRRKPRSPLRGTLVSLQYCRFCHRMGRAGQRRRKCKRSYLDGVKSTVILIPSGSPHGRDFSEARQSGRRAANTPSALRERSSTRSVPVAISRRWRSLNTTSFGTLGSLFVGPRNRRTELWRRSRPSVLHPIRPSTDGFEPAQECWMGLQGDRESTRRAQADA